MFTVIAFATFVVLTFAILWSSKLLDPGRLREVIEQARRNAWGIAAAVLLIAVLTVSPPGFLAMAGLIVLVLFARSWMHEFVFLMHLKDSDFPGRFDKLVWALLMIGVAPVGLWIFRGYHLAHWPEPAVETGEIDERRFRLRLIALRED